MYGANPDRTNSGGIGDHLTTSVHGCCRLVLLFFVWASGTITEQVPSPDPPMPCAAKKSRQANAEPPSSTTTIDTINTASYGRRMHAWPPVRDPLNFDHWNR